MFRYIGLLLSAAALLALACYEPPPPEEPVPAWYWHIGPTASDLYDLAAAARDDVWAVGVDGNGAGEILHFRAFRWTFAELPEKIGPLYAVAAEPGGEAWAAGGGDNFVHWDGLSWRKWPHPAPGKNIYGLALVDELNGWAVGEGGRIFRFGGGEWTAETSPTTQTLRRVRVLSAKSAWAAGDGGTVLRYDGSSWKEEDFPPTVDLSDLHFFADDDGWVVGAVASLYRWNGSSFRKYRSPDPDMTYQCCGFAGSGLGWAGGDEMHLSRYQDDAWTLERNMPSGSWQLTALHMVSPTEGWAVGPRGAIMHYY
ncbi:MAG: hypothetical protein V3W11_06930 [bacterium]